MKNTTRTVKNNKKLLTLAIATILAPVSAFSQLPATIELSNLDGNNGFTITGLEELDQLGFDTSSAGDINNDGIDDFIVGARTVSSPGLTAYVIFGTADTFPTFELSDLDGSNGFSMFCGRDLGQGLRISGLGDINGDGIDDLGFGNLEMDSVRGAAYIVYGRDGNFDASLDLSTLNGEDGFILEGTQDDSALGSEIVAGGDINGDGMNDLLIAAYEYNDLGAVYVLFGTDSNFPADFELSSLDGNNGFVINGFIDNQRVGSAAALADLNGDGLSDIVVGARTTAPNLSGAAYVVFGSSNAFPATLSLSALNGSNGFSFLPDLEPFDQLGESMTSLDINNDGIEDIAISAAGGNGENDLNPDAGEIYVLFGNDQQPFPTTVDNQVFDGNTGFVVFGANSSDFISRTLSSGDFNADGVDDLLMGAPSASAFEGDTRGITYVLFGSSEDNAFPSNLSLSTINGTNGIQIIGVSQEDFAGQSAGAGDVNDDGADDILIGARLVDIPDPKGGIETAIGRAYVVFGREDQEEVFFIDGFE